MLPNALFCRTALLPEGWRDDVRLVFADGLVGEMSVGAAPLPNDARCAIAIPGLSNLHSHASSARLPGSPSAAETRLTASGPGGP